jgi:hypothetical protein
VGQNSVADDVLRTASDEARSGAERLLAGADPDLDALSGDFRLEATWDGGASEDLDLVIVHPDGYRVSWLGAPTRAVISATDVSSRHREGLALRGAKAGDYAIEVVRTTALGNGAPLRGEVTIRVGKQTRTIPFALSDERTRLATVGISMRSRLVPL